MISILTPAYIDSLDKMDWLNEMIKSVKDQFFEEWELILIDDSSPLDIQLQETDKRVRRLRTSSRSGPALCRNTAARLARFDCLLPIDADDLLSKPDALATMYSAWKRDTSKVIYGDLQRYEQNQGQWQGTKIFDLPEYSFQKVMDLNGIIPVTAMHSFECHIKAGGWKPELEAGLEDVEYWISAGKAGYCGQHLSEVVLLYRKHDYSRHALLRGQTKRETEMRNIIRTLHTDVYGGKYPMGCCGGGGNKAWIPPDSNGSAGVAAPSTLDQYASNEKVWVEYNGQREGGFGIIGQYTGIPYNIDGIGHKLEVHIHDLPKFKRSGRGLDFTIGVGMPREEPKIVVTEPTYQVPEPQTAQILRLDEVMA
jgi:hypothetical protein